MSVLRAMTGLHHPMDGFAEGMKTPEGRALFEHYSSKFTKPAPTKLKAKRGGQALPPGHTRWPAPEMPQ